MDFKKTIGSNFNKLSIIEVIQVYFGINRYKAEYIFNNQFNNITQQNIVVSDLDINAINHSVVMRNKNAFNDNYSKLTSVKARRKYYSSLRKRIRKESTHVCV